MSQYQNDIQSIASLKEQQGSAWDAINPESVARMRAQNRFKTGLDIARYTAGIMRRDMAAYDADPSKYTQSLGCWHGFIGQQKMISIKKHFNSPTAATSTCRAGWSPRCARNSARCRTSRCTRRPRSRP
jgi:isocitrate lyase